jgi:hyperosmotically inducible periplasmic protein
MILLRSVVACPRHRAGTLTAALALCSTNVELTMQRNYVKYFVGLLITAFMIGCAASPQRASTGEMIDDTAITAKVKAALVNDPQVKARDINVETFRGTVQLNGFVDDRSQIDRAVELTRSQRGVKSVVNNLQVKSPSG